jgi:predicted flap endonuclease-1-like 5' DNA nuclease
MKIEQLPGLEPQQTLQLQASGIRDCRHLLRACRRRERFADLVVRTELAPHALHTIAQRAELSQIHGVGPATLARLLEAGVTSLAELAGQEPAALQERLLGVAPHAPNLAVIEHWILQARRQCKAWS